MSRGSLLAVVCSLALAASVTLTMSSGRLLDPGYLQRAWSPC
ncbi:MAG: hypothetical protein ACYC0H_00280 [Solirubrobacteraceae bacterium]